MISEKLINTVTTGDARELIERVPDYSIDLILTDPEYDRIDDYRWLSSVATRKLKDNRACLAFCGIGNIPQTHEAMGAGGLTYRWRFVLRHVFSIEFHGKLLVTSSELLWYERGQSKLFQSQLDVPMISKKGVYDVDGSNWGKSEEALSRFVAAFTQAGDVVLDPFAGLASIGVVCKQMEREYIGFEIDPDVARRARAKLGGTQPPLPGIHGPSQRALKI